MTVDDGPHREPSDPQPSDPTPDPPARAPEPEGPPEGELRAAARVPGLTTFTIEGRAAPGLFVVGWLATLVGFGIALVALLASGGAPAGILFVVGLAVLGLGLVATAGSQTIERRVAGGGPYRGPSPVLVFAAALPLTVVLVIAVGTPLVALGLDPEGPLALLVSLAVHAAVYVGLVRLLVVGTASLATRDLGLRVAVTRIGEDVAWGAVLAVPVLFATGLVGRLLSEVLPVPPSVVPPPTDAAGVVATFIAVAIVAPVGEEVFFRGFATTAWARTDGPRAALVRGSIFFAVAHVLTLTGASAGEAIGFAAFAFLSRLPVAFALGWIFLRRRSLYASIAMHAVFNGIQILALAALPRVG